jgi:spore cortex biosynthesis protein YabQ
MSLTVQFYTMLAMIGMGSYFGAALDTYSRLFNRTKRNLFVRGVNDILFWILQALLIFYVLYLVNNGEIRFYIFLALLCGFAFYQSLLKKIYTRFLEYCIRMIIQFCRFAAKLMSNLIIKPVVLLFTFIFSTILMLGKLLWRLLQVLFKVIISILKIILRPFTYLGKYVWKAFLKSFKIKGYNIFKRIANSLKWVTRLIDKIKKR